MARKNNSSVNKARQQLINQRRQLIKQQTSLKAGISNLPISTGGSHMSDHVNENDVNHTLLAGIGKQLREIDLKLDRLDDPNYGICINCHEKIAAARLEAIPGARLCLKCKELSER